MTSPRTYPHGVPCWIDLDAPDPDAAQAFYGGLLGWTFERVTPAGAPFYAIATLGGRDVGGIGTPQGDRAAWNTYVAVDDVDATAARVSAGGGAVIAEPAEFGAAGRGASCADPSGAAFRLWEAGDRPGAQVVNEPGSWNFSNLRSGDPGAAAFYGALFGWEIQDLGFATLVRRPGYGDHLESTVDPQIRQRQREVGTPDGFEDAVAWIEPVPDGVSPHWHVSIGVADRDDAVADAQRLGGEALDTADSRWARTALLRDPLGAQLTVSQFTP